MDPVPQHSSPRRGEDRLRCERARLEAQRQQAVEEKAALYMALLCSKNIMRSIAARLDRGDLDRATIKSLVKTLRDEADHAGEILEENDSLRAPLLRRAA